MSAKEQECWRGLSDGPWPHAQVLGELDRAEPEWLLTNDQGVYAMSTLALMHTRRQHGIFATHLGDDFRRHVVLSHLETTLEVAGRYHNLATHQFPNVAPTPGYRTIERFAQDPLPRWKYRLPTGTMERTLCLVRGYRAMIMAFTWSGKENARLILRPLMPMRPADALCEEHGAMLQKVTLRAGEVEVQPVLDLPAVVFRHGGVFMGSPDWWRKFEYLDDRGRYVDFQEDMWSPGVFELELVPRQTQYLMVFVGRRPEGRVEDLFMESAQHILACDPGQDRSPEERALAVACESFVWGDGEAIVAGYPWLDMWSRDWLLALPGTFLARGQLERARRSILLLFAKLTDGFLPQRLTALDEDRAPCIDASLWAFLVVRQLVEALPDPTEFLDQVFPTLQEMFERITEGNRPPAWLTAEGLLENGGAVPLTWMDAKVEEFAFTPRQGLAVELQALWISAACCFAELCELRGETEKKAQALAASERARVAFQQLFWCNETSYPFDCRSGSSESDAPWVDPSIRPNALIALAVLPDLFEAWQRRDILTRVEELLLTERGIRSLSPDHALYRGNAGGTIEERRESSHQGTVWTHLMLYYVRAKLHEYPESRAELREQLCQVMVRGRTLGHVAQNADGDAPHRFRGSPAYASATAMLLEALVFDLAENEET